MNKRYKRLLSLLFLICFICFDKVVAESSSEVKLPNYLRSAPKKKKRESVPSNFEKEVNEVDPLLIPSGAKPSLPEDPNEDTDYGTLNNKKNNDMETIYSTHEKEKALEEHHKSTKTQKESNLDRVFEQDEININNNFFKDFNEKNLVKNDTDIQKEKALINAVFGSEFEEMEEEEEMEGKKINLNLLGHSDEGSDSKLSEIIESYDEEEKSSNSSSNKERNITNYQTFKQGIHTFYKNCVLYSEPGDSSEPVGLVKEGKAIWLDKFNDQWHKAYTKENAVYLKASCLK